MGLLKHVVLPLFGFFHAMTAYTAYFGDRHGMPSQFDWPANSVETPDGKLTLYEDFLFGIVGCFHASFFVGCLMGIVLKDASTFRLILAVMECVMWGVGGLDGARLLGYEAQAAYSSFILSGIAAVGIVVHQLEPGIFTKDKETTKTKNK